MRIRKKAISFCFAVVVLFLWVIVGYVGSNAFGSDLDQQLVEKFAPTLVLDSRDHGVSPEPVGIMGAGSWCSIRYKVFDSIGNPAGEFDYMNWSPGFEDLPSGIDHTTGNYSGLHSGFSVIAEPPGLGSGWYFLIPHFEFPGTGPDTWGAAYQGLGDDYDDTIYAHILLTGGSTVIQYWFFYPYNDWVNNHEGDWEHINVFVSGQNPDTASLVKVQYYFHHLLVECTNQDNDYFVLNGTHPVVFVAGYGEELFGGSGPGGHGAYPCPGVWQETGGGPFPSDDEPNGVGRVIYHNEFDIVLLKHNPDDYDYDLQPEMSWFKADIPWGSIEVDSPTDWAEDWAFLPLIPNDLGNDAPHGPAHNRAWETPGAIGDTYEWYTKSPPYSPVRASGWQPPAYLTIENPSFERLSGSDIVYWETYGSGTFDSSIQHIDGARSAHLSRTSAGEDFGFYQKYIAVQPPTMYHFGVWVKTQGVSSGAVHAAFGVWREDGPNDYVDFGAISGDTDWTYISGNRVSDYDEDKIEIRLYGSSDFVGEAWFDGIDFGTGYIPGSITGFGAIAGNGEVHLSWDPYFEPECTLGYCLMLAYSSGNFDRYDESRVVHLPDATTEYTWGDLTNGVTYYFKVESDEWCYPMGVPGYSEEVSATPQNHAPTADAQSVTTNEDTPLSITLSGSDPDGDNLTYHIVNYPTKGTLTGTPPNLTYTPSNRLTDYTDSFTFTVNDGTVSSSEATVTITVSANNDAPTITTSSLPGATESVSYSTTMSATDPESQTLTWSLYSGSLPPGLSLSSGGTISGTPGQLLQTTPYSFTVRVTDGTNPVTKGLSITVNANNDAPVIDSYSPSSSSITMDEGNSQSFSVSAHDPENQSLSYQWTKNGSNVGSGTSYTYSPSYNEGTNTYTINVTVSDGSCNDSHSWSVTVNNVNRAPTLSNPGNKEVDEGSTLSFSLSASDPDGDAITYSKTSGPGSLSGNSYSWTPGYSDAGNHSVTFKATDPGNLSDSETITITVNDVDITPPSVSIWWPPSDNGSSSVTFQWSGSDNITPDSELTYSYNLDGGSWSGWTSSKSKSYTGLSYHWHTFGVMCKDNAGNTGSDSEQYHVNIPAPVLQSATPGYYEVSLSWSSSPDATGYKVKYWRYNPYSTVTIDVGNTMSKDIGLVAGITHYFKVCAYCAHGKVSYYSNTMSAVPEGGGGW